MTVSDAAPQKDPHPARRHRRAGTRALRAAIAAVRAGRAGLADGVRAAPAGAGVRVQAGPVRPGGGDGVRAAGAVAAGCGVADAEERAGDGVRGQDGGGVRAAGGSVQKGGVVGEEEAEGHVGGEDGGF